MNKQKFSSINSNVYNLSLSLMGIYFLYTLLTGDTSTIYDIIRVIYTFSFFIWLTTGLMDIFYLKENKTSFKPLATTLLLIFVIGILLKLVIGYF